MVGVAADEAVFQDLIKRAAAADTIEEKNRLYSAAAGAEDVEIARQALQSTLSGSVPDEAVPKIALSVARLHPELAFDFVTSNLEALKPKLGANAQEWLIPLIAANSGEARLARRLDAFASRHFRVEARRRLRPRAR